jgi:hypothetical protein
MVGERTDLAHCLLEGVLDFEAQSVQLVSLGFCEISA